MRLTGAGVMLIVLTCIGLRAESQARTYALDGGTLVGLINDKMTSWTVENGSMNAVTSVDGMLTVSERAGWVHPRLTIASGSAVSFDVRTTSSTGRALLIVGAEGLMTPVRGYTLAFPSGSRPARRDEGLHMLEVDSAAIAKIGKTPADWTRYEIRFDADHVTVIVDGNRVVDRQEPGIAGGWFGVRAEVGSVALRNLDIGPRTQDVQVGARFVEISATFNTKGVEFGPWFRRFFARVKEHAFVPDAPASGHVAVTFSVRTDGSIADLTIASPA